MHERHTDKQEDVPSRTVASVDERVLNLISLLASFIQSSEWPSASAGLRGSDKFLLSLSAITIITVRWWLFWNLYRSIHGGRMRGGGKLTKERVVE